jgi:hypothetical protein
MSACGGKADIEGCCEERPLMTRNGHAQCGRVSLAVIASANGPSCNAVASGSPAGAN